MSEQKPLVDWRKSTERRPLAGPRGPLREPVYRYIGAVICEMRERLQISQKVVGEAVGWTKAQVSNVEAGRCRVLLHQLPMLAKVLRIPVIDLLPPEFK